MRHSYRRGQYNYIISWNIVHFDQDDSIHVHLSISRGQHVCIIASRFGHFQLMSQAESDVTERKEEDIALCHPHYVSSYLVIWCVCVQVPLEGQLCAGVRCLRAGHLHRPRLHPEPGHHARHHQHRNTVTVTMVDNFVSSYNTHDTHTK